jgi:hypothetical protein
MNKARLRIIGKYRFDVKLYREMKEYKQFQEDMHSAADEVIGNLLGGNSLTALLGDVFGENGYSSMVSDFAINESLHYEFAGRRLKKITRYC